MVVEAITLAAIAIGFIAWPIVDLYRAGRRYRQIDRELNAIARGEK